MKKRIVRYGFILVILGILLVVVADMVVASHTRGRLYSDAGQIPHRKVGLLLGTNMYLPNGSVNLYFSCRINAAAALYKAGKIEYIIVSGDNSRVGYDEPAMMREELLKRGVPADRIFEDYAGFRTLDSVVRCREIFGQDSVTVISQPFHNQRAIYIAGHKGIDAIGFNASDVTARAGMKTQLREKLARVKLFADILFNKQPKFLGQRVVIP
jgi:SanA protein